MPPEAALRERRAATAVVLTVAKRAARSGAIWGVLFGALILNEALTYHSSFPTVASREQFAQTFGTNAGLAAVIGPGHRLGTVQGFVAWRMFGLMIIVGSIWGLLTATRLLRGEEDAGRWELLLAGRTTRRQATGQALAGLAVGWVALWVTTAVLAVVAGSRPGVRFSVSASLFYATAGTASAAMFLAIGALTSQLGRTRRQANALAAAAFGVAYLLRMVADSSGGFAWLRWASPLGWVENLRPLTGSQWLALVPVILVVAAAAGGAVAVAGRRDLGSGMLGRPESPHEAMWLMGGPGGLATRLERWVAVAWVLGLGLLALIFGVTARVAAEASVGVKSIEQAVGRLGGHGSATALWLGYEFVFLAALVAFAAAGQVSAMRTEEADGHLDNLLARRTSRRTWLVGRLGFGAVLVIAAGLAAGIGGWMGVASRSGDIGFGTMLQAGLNVAAPALFVLGVGTLLYGLAPRLSVPILYGLVLWSFLIEIVGSSITSNHWLLDTAVLSHLGPVPATTLDWTSIAWLTGLGVIAVLGGVAALNRRDLAAA